MVSETHQSQMGKIEAFILRLVLLHKLVVRFCFRCCCFSDLFNMWFGFVFFLGEGMGNVRKGGKLKHNLVLLEPSGETLLLSSNIKHLFCKLKRKENNVLYCYVQFFE